MIDTRKGVVISVAALTIAACDVGAAPAVTVTPPLVAATAVVPTVAPPTASPEPPTAMPAEPTAAPPQPSPEALPLVYYYFAAIPSGTFPAGSVEIVPGSLILSPTLSDLPRGDDPAVNVRSTLLAVMADPRNAWTGTGLAIDSVSFADGAASVALSGQIGGAGDVVLIAARWQFLMTVFAEPAVQSATVTLNGDSIANLGISHDSQARPADYAFTRAEIEAFMADNAYN